MEIVNIRQQGRGDRSPLELISADRLAYLIAVEKAAAELLAATYADFGPSQKNLHYGDSLLGLSNLQSAIHALKDNDGFFGILSEQLTTATPRRDE